MTTHKRFGNRWTINECLQLQREFELLQLSVDEIAERHQRTPNAIMFKLDKEGFADYNMLYSNYHHLNNEMTVSNDIASVVDDEDEDEQEADDDSDDNDSFKKHIIRLEKQLYVLTEMMIQQSKGKNSFSLFG
jgi:hypothetical protein